MKSVMNHNFSQVPAPQIQRSTFDRSHGHKTTFNPGYLVPFFLDEILPGDTVKMAVSMLGRLSTMLFPIMDNVFLDTFFFFVPNRLLWTNWEKFNGAQDDPADSTDFLIPKLYGSPSMQFAEYSVFDYFGLPTAVTIPNTQHISALPLRAYYLIWNSWFRDENLQPAELISLGDGPDLFSPLLLLKRGKRHDYFTSCLPWPQKGDSVMLPLGDTAPVMGTGFALGLTDGVGESGLVMGNDNNQNYLISDRSEVLSTIGSVVTPGTLGAAGAKVAGVTTDPDNSGLVTDLSLATAATINQLRQAFAFQKILERDARGGTRYVEHLKAHWGVTSPDFRLQRPEYLGGSSARVNVSAVQQTSQSDITPQGNLAAFAKVASQARFTKSFVEHGYIIGLANVRADITYQEGLHKMWSRATRFDFYLPALAHLGEQAVLSKEICYETSSAEDVFGYQERWAEYRYKPSFVTGAFRSNAADTLEAWHLALDFGGNAPTLNADFIQDNPPMDRVLAVSSSVEPNIILDSYFEFKHTRPIPVYSVPGQIDRF